MKTRTALVSNSSSSSFILIGIPIMISELNESHITTPKSNTYQTIIFGKYMCEGRDVFPLCESGQLAFIKDNPELFTHAFTHCTYKYDGGIYELKKIVDAGFDISKMVVWGDTADQGSSYSLDSLLENYGDEIAEKARHNVNETYKRKYALK